MVGCRVDLIGANALCPLSSRSCREVTEPVRGDRSCSGVATLSAPEGVGNVDMSKASTGSSCSIAGEEGMDAEWRACRWELWDECGVNSSEPRASTAGLRRALGVQLPDVHRALYDPGDRPWTP